MFKKAFFLMLFFNIGAINAAIGCRDTVYTSDEWDVSTYHYQKCSCSCRNTIDEKGYCTKCGHYGRHDRGRITDLLLKELDMTLV